MKRKLFVAAMVAVFSITVSMAQSNKSASYKTAIGMKFYPGAVSFKQALNASKCLEVNAYFWKGIRVTGLYELHYEIRGVDGLRWYIGAGAHITMYSEDINETYAGKNYIGIDGVLGLDYKVPGAPLNLSLDWQPSIELGSPVGFVGGYGGLSVRYTLY
jgi:hypothetical protein